MHGRGDDDPSIAAGPEEPLSEAPSSATPDNKQPERIRPRDAATLVLIDDIMGLPRVLMGRRRPDQVFLPNKWVFPGGRVDREDRTLSAAFGTPLPEDDASLLLAEVRGDPSPRLPQALALAAIRETFEETGLVIGAAHDGDPPDRCPALWQPFLATGHRPAPHRLRAFARAITPPGRPRRYDTRFFYAERSAVSLETGSSDGELASLDWVTLDEALTLDIPSITRVIVMDLADHLKARRTARGPRQIPFYFHKQGIFERVLIGPPRENP